MSIESINITILFFFLIFLTLFVNSTTSINLLLTAEILWITLYSSVLLIGYIFDNTNIVSLTFFFLVLSAVEFGIGIILMLIQNTITRSLNLIENDSNFSKFNNKFKTLIQLNKINWK